VDDEETIRRVHMRFVQRLGHEAVAVEDGSCVVPALRDAAAADQPFDCVLMDVVMREVHGPDACRHARSWGFSGPIIAATGNAAPRDLALYEDAGFSSCLQKPFGLAELRAAIDLAFP